MVTWYGGDLVAKACRTYYVRPAGGCRGVVSIVRVGARLATCDSDARFGSRGRKI